MRLLGIVASVLVAATTSAMAKPLSITIRGEACDLSALDAELTSMLADKPVGESHVSVVTRGRDRALGADVLFVDADGRSHGPRSVTASTCEDLSDSIALVIVMAITDAAVELVPAPLAPPPLASATAHPAKPATSAPSADTLTIARSALAETTAGLSLDGYIGGAGGVTVHGRNQQLLLGARVRRGRASLSLQVRVDAPEEVQVTATGKITVTHRDVSFAPCAHVKSFAGCALVSVGLLHGRGEALHGARDAFAPVVAMGVRIGWEHFLTRRLALGVHADGRAILTSATFQVDYMPVWESSRVEGSVGVGLLARFL